MMSIKTVLTEATEEELTEAVQENLFALFGTMATVLPEAEIMMGQGLNYHHAFPTNPMFKGVWGTQLTDDELEAAIDHAISWFRARNAPYFFWWTGPDTLPNDLGIRLQARGLLDMAEQQQELAAGIRQTDLGASGMVADLHEMNEAVLTQTPPGFTIVKVNDEKSLYDFKRVFVDTYQIPDWAGQAWVDATLALGIGETPWCMYVGYLNGQPVATNMLFTGGGVAGLYAVATIPAAQGQGIGAAISLKPLLDARDKGYHYGVLFSTEMGVRVYQRIGFRLTDVRINRYLWRND
jgi:GNAT superfamily N-acetyltransferase